MKIHVHILLLTLVLSLCICAAGCGGDEAASVDADAVKGTENISDEESGPISCADLYDAAVTAAGEGTENITERSSCTFLPGTYWDSLEDFCYASDDEQIYCLCIVRTDGKEAADEVMEAFLDTLASQLHNSYLTVDEQAVIQAARTGSFGQYVWYISLSDSSDVNRDADNALRDLLQHGI